MLFLCSGSDQVPLPVCGVLLSVEEEAESEHEDPGWTDRHAARHKCKKRLFELVCTV